MPIPLKPIESITIIGKRWFQETYGNTYHSCRVIVNDEELPKVDFAYGYDDGYIQTAFAMLQKAGYFPITGLPLPSGADADWNEFLKWKMANRDKVHINCQDVTRKRDL